MAKTVSVSTSNVLIGILLMFLLTLSACYSAAPSNPGEQYGLSKSEWLQLKKAGGGTCPSLIQGEISQLKRNN